MNIIGILQARTGSSRFKNKILKKIYNKSLLEIEIERIKQSKKIDKLIVATSINSEDNIIEDICIKNNIYFFRGSLNNVLERFYKIINIYKPAHIVRLTADCPLIDPEIIDLIINEHLKNKSDYTSNTIIPTYPDGMDVEVVKSSAIMQAHNNVIKKSDKEHVTSYINQRPNNFKLLNIENSINLSKYRLTVDYYEDFLLIKRILFYLKKSDNLINFNFNDIIDIFDKKPEIFKINKKYKRNETFYTLTSDEI
tara:strand:- start:189 stop:947 length:759 start_codon:yes stop_codon:yes gene_type:complete